jgi:hypothetical protein
MSKHIVLTKSSGSLQLAKISLPIDSLKTITSPQFGDTIVEYDVNGVLKMIAVLESAPVIAGRINSILG